MKQSHKTLLLWILIATMFFAIWHILEPSTKPNTQVAFSEFMSLVDAPKEQQHVESVAIKEREYTFTVIDPTKNNAKETKVTIGPDPSESEVTTAALVKAGVRVNFEKDEGSPFWSGALITILPMIFLIVMFYLFMRQLQAGGGKAMSFGKSRARLLSESANKVTFADVAGIDEAKDELEEIIAFLKDPKKFQKLGGRIPKGVLMMGPPGTGKTLLARAIAGEAGVPFFSMSGSDFVEMFVGVGASRVRDLFEQGKKNAPCIIFIDEIDAVGRHRGAGMGGGHDEREQTLNQLLVEMDGFETNEGVILLAATNRPDVLDPALLRPGRFDRQIVVDMPDLVGREAILKVHIRKVKIAPDVSAAKIAAGTPGMAGADLENLVNEAALLAARKNHEQVNMDDFEDAKEKVMLGPERRSRVFTDAVKREVAYHEAGHAVVAWACADSDPVHKVTIIPRGQALGLTAMLPVEDQYTITEQKYLDQICVALGGRVAEDMFLGKIGSGAYGDIKAVTSYARTMVTRLGMSRKMGPIAYEEGSEQVFLGRDFGRTHVFSEKTLQEIDAEIKRIVDEQFERARTILGANREKVETLKDALLERESIDAEEFKLLMKGQTLPERVLNVDHSVDGATVAAAVTSTAAAGDNDSDGGNGDGSGDKTPGVDHPA